MTYDGRYNVPRGYGDASGVTGGRVAVLLGAGASADAGLPLTEELAARLVRRANSEEREIAVVKVPGRRTGRGREPSFRRL